MRNRFHAWRAGLALVLAGSLVLAACSTGTSTSATTQTSTATIGAVEATVSGTGSVTALADVTLSRESGGSITAVLVKTGDRVAAGQPLLRVDTRELELQLAQAEASLASAQASYAQKQAGATPAELEQAEASLRSAQAKYEQTEAGTTTAQDLASAQAALRSAQAKYQQTLTGTTTPQDLAGAEAALRSAQAKLADLQAGPDPADVDTAVQQLNQAKDNRAKQDSQLSLAKEQARTAMEQAANDLRSAQASYGAAKLIWDEAERTGKDPNIAEQENAPKGYRDLTDAKRRQYKAAYEAAALAMANAEQALEQKKLAYEDARKQEIAGLQTANSQVLAAQINLDQVKAGASALEIIQAEASVDQARASLEKLQRPADAADVAQARAAVDQAQASLDKLRQPVKATELAQAQASVDQAQSTLNDLKAGAKPSELAVALASVKQATASRDLQQLKLAQATLTAPFAGVVAAVDAMPGQQTADNADLIKLVDDSTLSVDANIAESDVARVAVGQAARVTLTALPDNPVTGKVTAIAPKSTVTSNVVSYLVKVALDKADDVTVMTGMTADVAIVTASKQDVMVVPNKAVRTQAQQKVVLVQIEGQSVSTPVQVGLVGDSLTEIVSGLKEGDVVVISSAATTTTTTQPGPSGPLGIPAGAPPPKS